MPDTSEPDTKASGVPPASAHHKSARFSTFVSTTAVCGVLIGAAWWLLTSQHRAAEQRSHDRGQKAEPVVVTVAEVTPRVVQRTVSVVGSLYGQEEIVIRPKVGGRVVEIVHEIGDRVTTGDVLLRVERTEYELAAAEAQRGLELELSKLGLKELPGDDFDTAQLPSVVRARVEEQNAQSRLNRMRELNKRQVLTGEELETAETNFTVARVNSQQMRVDAQSMLATAHHRQAALNTALQKLSETQVIVPGGLGTKRGADPVPHGENTNIRHNGKGADPVFVQSPPEAVRKRSEASPDRQEYVVADRAVAVGEIISATVGNDPGIFKLVIDNPLKLVTTLPERHRSEIRLGQVVDLHVEYAPATTFPGTVARINPVIDRASRTFEVEITVPNDDRRLSAGSFVRASINTHVDEQAATVPEQSLVKLAGVTKVFVVRDGVVHEVPVQLLGRVTVPGARYSENWVEIGGELPAQSKIVTSGFSQLSVGSPVRIRTADVAAREQETHP